MATQSKSVSQLKSEVLKPSSRPYELIEYNSDKLITGEINPELVASNVNSPYEKNSSGTIIIDKNKDLTKRKMLISLTATKISNVKFNEIIDTEFQDFVESVDLSQNFLSSQINGMQIKAASDAADKKVLQAKIAGLLNQNEALQAASALTKVNINTAPDSISYGTDLNADNSGVGNMLLSKNKKARAVITNTSFKVTLGNYDHTGKLLDGEEVVTFQPIFAGNIGTKNLTDAEAAQYLINNPDLEPYFNGYGKQSNEKLAEVQTAAYNGLAALVSEIQIQHPAQPDAAGLARTNAYLDEQIQDANVNSSLNTRRNILAANGISIYFDPVTNSNQVAGDSTFKERGVEQIKIIKRVIQYKLNDYNQRQYGSNFEENRKITYFRNFYRSIFNGITTRFILRQLDFQAIIIALRKTIAEDIRNFKNIPGSYNIPVLGGTKSIPIDRLITAADRILLTKTRLSEWQAANVIEAAKKHWRYVVEQKPNELDTRFYLSDAQARSYLSNYGDLQAVYGNDLVQAKKHWNIAGLNEGRTFAAGNSLLHIYRNDVDKKGYIEIVKGQPWHVRYSSEYSDLSKSSRIFLDDNGILYLYDKAKIVWQSFNE